MANSPTSSTPNRNPINEAATVPIPTVVPTTRYELPPEVLSNPFNPAADSMYPPSPVQPPLFRPVPRLLTPPPHLRPEGKRVDLRAYPTPQQQGTSSSQGLRKKGRMATSPRPPPPLMEFLAQTIDPSVRHLGPNTFEFNLPSKGGRELEIIHIGQDLQPASIIIRQWSGLEGGVWTNTLKLQTLVMEQGAFNRWRQLATPPCPGFATPPLPPRSSELKVAVYASDGSTALLFSIKAKEVITLHAPDIFVILETQCGGAPALERAKDLGFDGVRVLDCIGVKGGVWFLWNRKTVHAKSLDGNFHFLHMAVHKKAVAVQTTPDGGRLCSI